MKNVLVTGVYGNLGRAVASRFLGEGYRVGGILAPGEDPDSLIQHADFSSVVADLADPAAAATAIGRLSARGLDVAVLTVGGFAMNSLLNTDLKELQKMIRLNFETAFNCVLPVLQKMKGSGRGRIFLVGARPALDVRHSRGMFAYGLSKMMVLRLAEMINLECSGEGITATVVIPSTIDTPQNRASMPDADPADWVKPEQIAELIFFHSSDQAAVLRESVIKAYGNS